MREKVKLYLETTGTKQKWICEQIGVSKSHFSHWIHGDREMDYIKLLKLKKLIGIN